eukprot:m.60474 g.60474  ORF g.60474 m.60474 type:complete len:627 (+) comp11819_c0_seq4:154-2034(+)
MEWPGEKNTVKELQAFLGERGESTKGRKSELVARVAALAAKAEAEATASVASAGTSAAPVNDEGNDIAAAIGNAVDAANQVQEPTETEAKRVKREPTSPTSKSTPPAATLPVEEPKTKPKVEPVPAPDPVRPEPTIDEDEDEEEEDFEQEEAAFLGDRSRNCPYLDTIKRSMLDFDFEKLCSVSMSNQNVYACLVCGKYFQGRGKGTHAYMHSLEESHHVFLNLHSLRFYCLPDSYEVIDPSLDDIKFVLQPTYAKRYISSLDALNKPSRALDGKKYIPGVVGLNDIKANDYVNVVVQALNRIPPFRNFFLDPSNTSRIRDPLVLTMGELIRKINNPRAFKGHVSPHEFLQAVITASRKRFKITEQSDPYQFMTWLLNTLDRKLQKKGHTIISDTFKGRLGVKSRKIPPADADPTAPEFQPKYNATEFMVLGLDLPDAPLFHDEAQQNVIPQVPLFQLLNKFDGVTEHEYKAVDTTFFKTFQIEKLPQYILLHIKRFKKNSFFIEKNPTIVNFPVKNIDFGDYIDPEQKDAERSYSYDLLANIVHDGLPGPGKGTYRAHVRHKGSSTWYEMQDLHVVDILPEMITLTESYIQVWECNPDYKRPVDQTMETGDDAEEAEAAAPAAAE